MNRLGVRSAPADEHRICVRRHDEEVGVELAGKSSEHRSLSITASTPMSLRSAPGSYMVGMPPPPAQMTIVPCSSSQLMGRISKMRLGSGRRHDASPLGTVLLE